ESHANACSRSFNRCTQSRAASANHENVVFKSFVLRHRKSLHRYVVLGGVAIQQSRVSNLDCDRLNNPPIVPDSHSTEPDVKIGKADPEQTQPRPKHVPAIQTTHTGVAA